MGREGKGEELGAWCFLTARAASKNAEGDGDASLKPFSKELRVVEKKWVISARAPACLLVGAAGSSLELASGGGYACWA